MDQRSPKTVRLPDFLYEWAEEILETYLPVQALTGDGKGRMSITEHRISLCRYAKRGPSTRIYFQFLENWMRELGYGEVEAEIFQVSTYEEGHYYKWHHDDASLTQRKWSMSALISSPHKFKGGDLEFENIGPVFLKQQDAIIFPSDLRHQVTPVTQGVRHSLVVWFK